MPTVLPNYYTVISSQGSAWDALFTMQNDDKTPMNITGKTFTFVARPSVTNVSVPPQIEVVSGVDSPQGTITVDTLAATVFVEVTADANSGWTGGSFTLWMNAGLPDAAAMVQGPYLLQPTTAP